MSTYVSFPWAAHIHGEECPIEACWPLPKGAVHRRGTPSVSSFESLETYVSSKGASTSTGRGVLSVLKVPTQIETDATTKLQSILERDDRARISFIRDTLPAFAVSVKDALVAVLPFRRPEPERAGLSNMLYLWDADMEED